MTVELDEQTAVGLTAQARARNLTLVEYLRRLAIEEAQEHLGRITPEQRVAALRAWAESHKPVSHFVDDSRESIYEGRGE